MGLFKNADWFWALLDEIARDGGDIETRLERLEQTVGEFSFRELKAFDKHLYKALDAAYLEPVWAAAYIAHGGCSDDWFLYFRAGMLLFGSEVYQRMIHDPDDVAEVIVEQSEFVEDVLYLASSAAEERYGREIPERRDHPPSLGPHDFDAVPLPKIRALASTRSF